MTDYVVDSKPSEHAARLAAQLEIFPIQQGRGSFERAPLEVEVSLGEQEFREGPGVDAIGFILQFRRVIIEVQVEGGFISSTDRYERTLPDDVFKQYVKRAIESAQGLDGELEFGFGGVIARLLDAVGLTGKARLRAATELKRGNLQRFEGNLKLKIVRLIPGGRWEVGHSELGDPAEANGLLRGAYLNEPADGKQADDDSPLCYIEPINSRGYKVIVELRAALKDCDYLPTGPVLNDPMWARLNRNAIEKILVTKMMQEQNRADGLRPPAGEIILSRGEFRVRRKRSANGR